METVKHVMMCGNAYKAYLAGENAVLVPRHRPGLARLTVAAGRLAEGPAGWYVAPAPKWMAKMKEAA